MLTNVLEEIKSAFERPSVLTQLIYFDQVYSDKVFQYEDEEFTFWQIQGVAFQGLAQLIYDEFTSTNTSVEVVKVEIGNVVSDDVVSVAHSQFWLKVTTKEHGWLHVYLNAETQSVEWY